MKDMPKIITLPNGGKAWEHSFDSFCATVYLPSCDLLCDIINYGFRTPYLLIFGEKKFSPQEAQDFADEKGLSRIAREFGGSVVFIFPTSGSWETAPTDLFASIISNTKYGQYYQDGVTLMYDRFTGEWGDKYIRGALLRSCLFGYGTSADYIAKNCLQTIIGDGIWGKSDIAPVCCVLQGLSVIPAPTRRDLPVVSVGNSQKINDALIASLDHVRIKEQADYYNDFHGFMKKFRRMVGFLDIEEDYEALGMMVEPGFIEVKTAADNRGDDKDTTEHKIGYVAYYNKQIMDKKEKLPLVLCFHGGGDSAMCMVTLSDWHLVVNKYNFLLVAIENHLNSTATEMMEFLSKLKEKYPIDEEQIYATGFSMGGCKSWDMVQEYPEVFAAVAPMDATFEVGLNSYGQPAPKFNETIPVPVFYVGGEQTPLPELSFQAQKCFDRMKYMLKLNKVKKPFNFTFEDQAAWENKIHGMNGDLTRKAWDFNRNSILTMELFESENGCCYTIFASASNQQHEMRHLNCENAWKFFSKFRRKADGSIVGGEMKTIADLYAKGYESFR